MNKSDEFSDRRFTSRIAVSLPVTIEIKDHATNRVLKLPSSSINLSAGGVSFMTSELIPTPMDVHAEVHSNAKAIRASGQIVWNHNRTLNLLTNKNQFKYGMQFLKLDDVAESELGQFLSQRMLSKEYLCERRITTSIVSELINFKNRDGKKIVGFFDHLKDCDTSKAPFILIPAAYGETKKDALSLSYYLVKNGFNVVRYDNTDHVGESDGEIFNTTLTKMKSDLLSTVDYVEGLGCKKIGVIAASLAARVAIKAAAEDPRISMLACFVPVVNLQHTLNAVYYEDFISNYLRGKRWHATHANILGFEVHEIFLDTAIRGNFHDLRSTLKDLRELSIPTIILAAENDLWINLEDIKVAFESIAATEKEIFIISDAIHRLDGNPEVNKSVQKQIVRCGLKYLCNKERTDLAEPNTREIAIQNRIERERQKNLIRLQDQDEKAFWCKYLGKFKYVVNIPDYWHLLGSITDFLGRASEREAVLDAGCGNGSFGAFLLVHAFYKNKDAFFQTGFPLFSYVGLDFVESALEEAKSVHENLQFEFIEKLGAHHLVSCSYVLSDLNRPLTFKNDSFDKICCNLVVSYLQNPLLTLKELVRVLKPKGRLIVTSLKPHADLTKIYRNFIKVAGSDEEIEEARRLLNNIGAIKCKEAEGYYNFFSERELTAMIAMTGAKKIQAVMVLADQVNLIVAEKD